MWLSRGRWVEWLAAIQSLAIEDKGWFESATVLIPDAGALLLTELLKIVTRTEGSIDQRSELVVEGSGG